MKKIFSLSLLLLVFGELCAQETSVIVNPDGTHSVVINNGATGIQVNPDGTHTQIFNNGATSIKVNPDGTHTVVFNNGPTSTQVNPDGTHTIIFNNGATSTQVNPDGTHTIISNNGATSTQVNPDGTHTIIYNKRATSTRVSPNQTQTTTILNINADTNKKVLPLNGKNDFADTATYIRVHESRHHIIQLNGKEISPADLDERFKQLKIKGGIVFYSCERATKDLPDNSKIIELAKKYRLPVRIFRNNNF